MTALYGLGIVDGLAERIAQAPERDVLTISERRDFAQQERDRQELRAGTRRIDCHGKDEGG